MQIITQSQIEKVLKFCEAVEVIEKSFVAASTERIVQPPALVFSLKSILGEICMKTAFDPALPTYTIKQVSVFQNNTQKNIPTLSGTMNIYNSETGQLLAVLAENGWLTNIRTACAGAIADKYCSQRNATTLGIVGTGTQALFQLKMILSLSKKYTKIFLWNRSEQRAEEFLVTVQKEYPSLIFTLSTTIEEVVQNADTILTCTSAQRPLIEPSMVEGGKTIIGIGADMPKKCELNPLLLQKVDKLWVDKKESNFILGDVANAIKCKVITKKKVTGELGEVIEGKKQGREHDGECVIVKLVGLGAQDTYMGNYVYSSLYPASNQTK